MHISFEQHIRRALDQAPAVPFPAATRSEGALASAYDVAGLALAAIGAAASELAALQSPVGGAEIDERLAQLWFGFTLRPEGWQIPSAWDPIAGDYASADGWIRLHTNAPHHRAAAVSALGLAEAAGVSRDRVQSLVKDWQKAELQEAVVAAGGCAAGMLTPKAWAAHPQGQAVSAEPLIHWQQHGAAPPLALDGLKVLDLTRVLAGPVATRFLAGFGAKVLRIDPPGWEEAAVEPEVTLGKTCAGLDLRRAEDRARFTDLLRAADVLVHGYRPGALEGLGFGDAERRRLNPGLVDVALSAWGWTGPWQGRRGFDSLVQMSSGIAATGMLWAKADRPVPLPVQALDHATGYLMAAAVLHALRARALDRRVLSARLSLARTALLLTSVPQLDRRPALDGLTEAGLDPVPEQTDWGPAQRLRFPVSLNGRPAKFPRGASRFRSASAAW